MAHSQNHEWIVNRPLLNGFELPEHTTTYGYTVEFSEASFCQHCLTEIRTPQKRIKGGNVTSALYRFSIAQWHPLGTCREGAP
jgi:hypothetical protein